MNNKIKKYMKKTVILGMCAIIALSAAGCGNSQTAPDSLSPTTEDPANAKLPKVPEEENTASDSEESAEKAESKDSTEDKKSPEDTEASKDAKDSKSAAQDTDTSDRTPQTDRKEIQNNLRDAKDLIENDMIDDARAVIRALRTRDLTEEEKAEIDRLEKQIEDAR